MAKLGTPENPEIIVPGERPRGPTSSRWRGVVRLTLILGVVLAPAFVFDSACLWLVREGWHSDVPLAWLLALLILPAAALSTLIALVGAPLILLALVFLAMGRPVRFERLDLKRFRFPH